jgi:hypothetical protein
MKWSAFALVTSSPRTASTTRIATPKPNRNVLFGRRWVLVDGVSRVVPQDHSAAEHGDSPAGSELTLVSRFDHLDTSGR